MRNIVKHFPGVLANDHANLTIQAGEIHALLGENGAGKSTLMQVLCGFYAMDSGEIRIDGEQVRLRGPRDSLALGIGMVYQEFMLVPRFTVIENTVLGFRNNGSPLLDLKRASEKLKELSSSHGLDLDPSAEVGLLPVGVQQRVEIVKLLYCDARLLIMDEPTAVLTPQEKDRLFAILRKLREGGRSVVIVTHKLREVIELADRVTVMRDGKVVATRSIGSTSEQELAQLMVGREVNRHAEKSAGRPGEPVLRAEELRVRDKTGRERVRGVTIEVRAGEILGIAGVDGNGQSELAEALLGLREIASGLVLLNGADVTALNVSKRRRLGLSYIPADRRHVGSAGEMTIADNAILGSQRKFARGWLRDLRKSRASAERLIARFGIRGGGIDSPAGKLSGGNLQKLILGREIMNGSAALVVEQPTRGLDVGAVEAVWKELLAAREEGKAILMISAELEELLNLADRIAVMFEGRIVGTVDAAGASLEEIGSMMTGGGSEEMTADRLPTDAETREATRGEIV